MAYTKLDSGIVHSTVWREPDHVLRVWLTILAIKDRHGEVHSSIPGLAGLALVSVPECEEALQKFLSPDPYSRTKRREGRRLEEIPRGWFVINHDDYQRAGTDEQRREQAAERARRYRDRQKMDLGPDLGHQQDDHERHVLRDDGVTARDDGVTARDSSRQNSPVAVAVAKAGALEEGVVPQGKDSSSSLVRGRRKKAATTRETWLTPFWAVYQRHYPDASSKAVCGQLAKYVAPLREKHDDPTLCDQLDRYLRQTEPDYVSLAKFAGAFGKWTGKKQGGGNTTITRGREALQNFVREERSNGKR